MTPTPSGYFEPRIEPHCDHCGFPLRGLPEEGTCPECGTAYTPTSASRLQTPPSVGEVLTSLSVPWLVFVGVVLLGIAGANSRGGTVGAIFFLGIAAPLCVIWSGVRTYRYARAYRNEILTREDTQRPSMRTGRVLVGLIAALLLLVGIAATVLGVVIFAACFTPGVSTIGL